MPNVEICSVSTGRWISYNRPQILSLHSGVCLAGKLNKERKEKQKHFRTFTRWNHSSKTFAFFVPAFVVFLVSAACFLKLN